MNGVPAQSFATHKRYVPGFHFFAGSLIIINLGIALSRLVRGPDAAAVSSVLVAVVLAQLFWYTRQFPLSVQDRLICLEERLRLARLLPADLQGRIPEFTVGQMIALRYASDAELPALARRVLTEKIVDREAIKAMITDWRADLLRA
jgi:hypothetical protein